MPNCGSQITLCDLPIRFDTYEGCTHRCAYCFVQRKYDVISSIKKGEGVQKLLAFIEGKRSLETNWCDFNIPLHWGGMSDPFQPAERKYRYSLDALKILAETKYPFVVSTKNAMIAEEPYLSLIKECNCVVQFSACAPEYDAFETGASSFEERLNAARQISPFKRVVIRCQPYIPKFYESVKDSICKFEEVGAYGAIFEGIKYLVKQPGTIRLGGDFVYPTELYRSHFNVFKKMLHDRGMKFYCGENRLRAMGDSLCCCGVDGMGWVVNTANLNHMLYDKNNVRITPAMRQTGTATAFQSTAQTTLSGRGLKNLSLIEAMQLSLKDFSRISALIPDDQRETLKKRLRQSK